MLYTIQQLNQQSAEDFSHHLSGIYEHSKWVAEAVINQRPFASMQALYHAMQCAVNTASRDTQRELILAHPDLAGKLADAGELTEASTEEQASAGLAHLSAEERDYFTALNEAYRARFGFPFIICVKDVNKAIIREEFEHRLLHSIDEEHVAALNQIHRIAIHRLGLAASNPL